MNAHLVDGGGERPTEGLPGGTRGPVPRRLDRRSMPGHFDLWSYEDVIENKEAILGRLTDGDMPCDGPWPAEQVERFRDWVAAGTPA